MMTRSLWFTLGVGCGLMTWGSAADWPQWRGTDRTDVSPETGLLTSWPAGGPKRVWLYENAGQGYSGPAIVDGRLDTLGTRDGKEVVLALDAAEGRELWVTPIAGIMNNRWGNGPRSTPTVAGDHVFALGGHGDLVCFRRDDGRVVWRSSMQQLGGKVPKWGYTESVLVDGDLVVCTPGGSKGTMAALDRKTGTLRWQSAGLTDDAHYSSIIVVNRGGVRHYVQLTERSVIWTHPVVSGGRLFLRDQDHIYCYDVRKG
jgi:outer membrane protein assembly factor BamB